MTKIALIVRYILALVFLVSGASKLFSPQDAANFFAELIGIGDTVAYGLVIALSLAECLLAGVLINGRSLKAASVASAVFFLAAFVVGGLTVGPDTSCGCFGELMESKVDEWFMIRNAGLMFISIFTLKNSPTT